jgi:hypothetical protein
MTVFSVYVVIIQHFQGYVKLTRRSGFAALGLSPLFVDRPFSAQSQCEELGIKKNRTYAGAAVGSKDKKKARG